MNLVMHSPNWIYKGEIYDYYIEPFEAFVYVITRTNLEVDDISPYLYVGKKKFLKKSKKGSRQESDWREYWGSSSNLKAAIEKYGIENFKREIIHVCRTWGDAGYLEVKEQINRNVLAETRDGNSIYYNGNILGRVKQIPYNFEMNNIKEYFQKSDINGNQKNKIWITNGSNNRVIPEKEAEKIVGKRNWVYGKCPKQRPYTNQKENIMLPRNDDIPEGFIPGITSKKITDGKNNKLIPIEKIDKFLIENKKWYIGFSGNTDLLWITNGIEDLKIKQEELLKFEKNGYIKGRSHKNLEGKGLISLFKDNNFVWVTQEEIEQYLEEDWIKKGIPFGNRNRVNVTNNISQKWFPSTKEAEEFINSNIGWKIGQKPRKDFNTLGIVFVEDINTGENITVTKEEFNLHRWKKYIGRTLSTDSRKQVILYENKVEIFRGFKGEMKESKFYHISARNNKDYKHKRGELKNNVYKFIEI